MKIPNKYKMISIAAIILLTACNGVLKGVRSVTYPPDFNYISRAELTDTMQQFALYTTLLDQSLRDSANISEEQRETAISILGKMEKLSLNLGTETLSSNHSVVSFNIDQFRQNISEARKGLQQQPPNYYLAGSVSAYCLNCHSINE